MSDITQDALNLREILARIDRMLDEAEKFRAETRKFSAEQGKLASEQAKLYAEADKLRRDRILAPVLAAGALGGAIAAILAIMSRAWGVH